MPRRRPTYRQLPIPFPPADLAQPARLMLPPGLRDLATVDGLNDSQVRQLAEMWHTVRGEKPTTLAAWRDLYATRKRFVREEYTHAHP